MVKSDTTPSDASLPPPLPTDWTRCHEYMPHKRRYCRQQLVGGTNYCGNHQRSTERIPCPLDPSHDIPASQVEKHIKVCPFRKRQQQEREQYYYRENVNCGGHGDVGSESKSNDDTNTVEWAKRLARQVIQVHQQVFTGESPSDNNVTSVSYQNVINAIPSMDLGESELDKLTSSVQHYRIKAGGVRHLQQQASLVGHLRRIGVFNDTSENVTILEMGAGRGMFGLMAAGIAAKTCEHVKLVLVERSGSRSKADCVLRMSKDETDYMALNRVQFTRISSDLAHVYIPSVLAKNDFDADGASSLSGVKRKHESTNNSNKTKRTIVIAKHLCGVGTDLALKSLENDVHVDACVFATCCHGVCCWNDYVGRDFLLRHFGNGFGEQEFNLLRRWTAGTVLSSACCKNDGDDDNDDDEHGLCTVDDKKDPLNVSSIVRSSGLILLGPQGLGRACQRLLDQGRLEYMRDVLFRGDDKTHVEVFHYVPSEVTPQNAVLIAYRKK